MSKNAICFPLTGRSDDMKRDRLLTLFQMIEAAYDEGRIQIKYDPAQASVQFTVPREGSERMRRAYASGIFVMDLNLPNGLQRSPAAEPHVIW